MKIIYYETTCDPSEKKCGYVIAEEHDDYFVITEEQYERALKNLTVVGAELMFDGYKPVYVRWRD